jgi:hypothetical protein
MNTQLNPTAVQQTRDQFSTLRRALRGNGTFSLVSGLILIAGASPIAAFMGLEATAVFRGLGIVLAIYGLDLFWVASKEAIDRRLAWTAVILDIVWVVTSYALLLGDWLSLTTAGNWTIALLAEAVAVFAIWQYIGLRRAAK